MECRFYVCIPLKSFLWYYNLLFWTCWYGNVRHYQLVSFDNFPIIARGQLIEQRDSSIKTMLVFQPIALTFIYHEWFVHICLLVINHLFFYDQPKWSILMISFGLLIWLRWHHFDFPVFSHIHIVREHV